MRCASIVAVGSDANKGGTGPLAKIGELVTLMVNFPIILMYSDTADLARMARQPDQEVFDWHRRVLASLRSAPVLEPCQYRWLTSFQTVEGYHGTTRVWGLTLFCVVPIFLIPLSSRSKQAARNCRKVRTPGSQLGNVDAKATSGTKIVIRR